VEQSASRPSGHPREAVGSPSRSVLVESENTSHPFDPVEGGDEMHLGRSGICKADVDISTNKRANETFRTIHRATSSVEQGS
jgi:hypothetical protein